MFQFDAVAVVNLDRRPDRWRRIQENLAEVEWPFKRPIRWPGFDGDDHPPPADFGGTPGAWGCYRSHLALWDWAVREDFGSVLVLEDDAWILKNVASRAECFLGLLPDDWDGLYFGGRHYVEEILPEPINAEVLKGRCVLGTWAYALRGEAIGILRETVRRFPQALEAEKFNIDRIFASLHHVGQITVYTPWRWLVYHGGGLSDTNGRVYHPYGFELPDEVRRRLIRQLNQKTEAAAC